MVQSDADGGAGSPGQNRHFLSAPSSRLGRWSAGCAGAFFLLLLLNSLVFMPTSDDAAWRRIVLPFYGVTMIGAAIAGGILAVIAVVRKHERSWMVWLAMLPGAFALIFLLGEFLAPH